MPLSRENLNCRFVAVARATEVYSGPNKTCDNIDKHVLSNKMNVKFEFNAPKTNKRQVLRSQKPIKHVLHQLLKVDIFVVKVDISWYRCL